MRTKTTRTQPKTDPQIPPIARKGSSSIEWPVEREKEVSSALDRSGGRKERRTLELPGHAEAVNEEG